MKINKHEGKVLYSLSADVYITDNILTRCDFELLVEHDKEAVELAKKITEKLKKGFKLSNLSLDLISNVPIIEVGKNDKR